MASLIVNQGLSPVLAGCSECVGLGNEGSTSPGLQIDQQSMLREGFTCGENMGFGPSIEGHRPGELTTQQ